MIANVAVQPIIVPANGVSTISQTGSKLMFLSNTGTFNFSIDGGPFQTGLSILYLDFAQGLAFGSGIAGAGPIPISNIINAQFKQVLLQDTSGSANTITYYIGDGASSYVNPNTTNFQKDAPTYTRGNKGAGGNNDLSLADGATDIYNGTDGVTGKTRRLIVVQNVDAANTLYLLDAAGNRMATLKASGPPEVVVTSGTVKVQNVAGSGATKYNVMETFYS